jgi:hypothetical protein
MIYSKRTMSHEDKVYKQIYDTISPVIPKDWKYIWIVFSKTNTNSIASQSDVFHYVSIRKTQSQSKILKGNAYNYPKPRRDVDTAYFKISGLLLMEVLKMETPPEYIIMELQNTGMHNITYTDEFDKTTFEKEIKSKG